MAEDLPSKSKALGSVLTGREGKGEGGVGWGVTHTGKGRGALSASDEPPRVTQGQVLRPLSSAHSLCSSSLPLLQDSPVLSFNCRHTRPHGQLRRCEILQHLFRPFEFLFCLFLVFDAGS